MILFIRRAFLLVRATGFPRSSLMASRTIRPRLILNRPRDALSDGTTSIQLSMDRAELAISPRGPANSVSNLGIRTSMG